MQPADALFERFFDDLREIARRCLARERADHTLQTGDLLNEAYLLLRDKSAGAFRDEQHFKAHVALCLRHILVDYARARGAQKRGSNPLRVSLPEDLMSPGMPIDDILVIDDWLKRVGQKDEQAEQICVLHWVAGFSWEEAGRLVGLPEHQAKRADVWVKTVANRVERDA